jgi:methionine-S-sulfoxide reductase
MAEAIFAGGCFWCTEAVFGQLQGVSGVESGYLGGHVIDPTYKQVCGGDTGHAEAIRIKFDETIISYADLLDIFFATHDPTQLNRQGGDVGTQYRSAIFPLDDAQRSEAVAGIARASPIGRHLLSPPSRGQRCGIRRKIIIRNIGPAKDNAIPIVWPSSHRSWPS